MDTGVDSSRLWFSTVQVTDWLYLISEKKFFEGNRANIWLVKGRAVDVIIDTGLGVCDLNKYLTSAGLINKPDSSGGDPRQCVVVCTHVHFDHSGGAHHFNNVQIHELDRDGLIRGRQSETLNYVKPDHFLEQPFAGFSARNYKVPPTPCDGVRDGDRISLGGTDYLQVFHVPGHTKGSICLYYPAKHALFTGDFVYDCGHGADLLDWLPTSCKRDFVRSANHMVDFLTQHQVVNIYPGHFRIIKSDSVSRVLQQYIEAKDNCGSTAGASCMQWCTWGFFVMDCFRCCPC